MIQLWIKEKNTILCCDWAMTNMRDILSSCSDEAEEIAMLWRNMETDRYCTANKRVVAKFYDDDLEPSDREISLEGKIIT